MSWSLKASSARMGGGAPPGCPAAALHGLVEEFQATVERLAERLFFFQDDRGDALRVLLQLGEEAAHVLDHRGDEPGEEAGLRTEHLPPVAHGPTQDAAQHVPAPLVARHRPVGDRERQRADVVRDHAVGRVDVADVGLAELAAVPVRGGGRLLDRREDRREDVAVVVAALALQDAREAFEPHAGVDVLGRQDFQRAVGLAVELDKHVVPDLDHVRVRLVHQLRHHPRREAHHHLPIDMDLRARAARPRVAHLPEVVLHVAGDDPLGGQVLQPQLLRFEIRLQPRFFVPAEVRRVQRILRQLVHARQQFPRPRDRFGFKIITEGPVAEHLEERVVVRVPPDIVEVVVLAAGSDALLAVDRPLEPVERAARLGLPQKERLELVHPRVGEEQRRVLMRDHRRRRVEDVLPPPRPLGARLGPLAGEELDERRADPIDRPVLSGGVRVCHSD